MKSKIIIILLLLSFCSIHVNAQNQNCQSISDASNNTAPTENISFSTAPDVPNPTVVDSNTLRFRMGGRRATNMNLMNGIATTWEVRAAVSGLTAADPSVQYKDIELTNLMVTSNGNLSMGTLTFQAPYSDGGTVTLEQVLNNPLVFNALGSTHNNGMNACNNARNGNGNNFWEFDFDVEFENDFYFPINTYTPQLQFTIMCLTNCNPN